MNAIYKNYIYIAKGFSIFANAILMYLYALKLDPSSFSSAVKMLIGFSSLGLFETALLYLSFKSNKNKKQTKLAYFISSVCFASFLVLTNLEQNSPTLLIIFLICLLRVYTLYIENKHEIIFNERTHLIKMHAAIFYAGTNISLLYASNNYIISIVLSYFMLSFFLLIPMNYDLKKCTQPIIEKKETIESLAHTIFILKIIFSSISGYVLSSYMLTLIEHSSYNYKPIVLLNSVSNAIVALSTSKIVANRISKNININKIKFDAIIIYPAIGVILSFILIYFASKFINFEYSIEILAFIAITIILFLNCFFAINSRKKNIEPVFYSNIMIWIILIYFLFFSTEALSASLYVNIILIINIAVLFEIKFIK